MVDIAGTVAGLSLTNSYLPPLQRKELRSFNSFLVKLVKENGDIRWVASVRQ